MSIRNKILFSFSFVTIGLVSIALLFIYTLFDQYREQEFQLRQKNKIETTLKFLTEFKNLDEDLIEALDRITINDIYDEKLLIFDKDKNLVYTSIDDTPIEFSTEILHKLSAKNPLMEEKDGLYDVVALYIEKDGKVFFGISKAYDVFGYSKLTYSKNVLALTLLIISVVVILVSYYLSNKITYSIQDVTNQIKEFSFAHGKPITPTKSNNEVAVLALRFNELMQRLNEAFSFQKHAVHHISHELKTPIAVLVSNFERMENETHINTLKELIKIQKENTKSLSEIINSLLEIAKTESGNNTPLSRIRADELIFDLVDELRLLHPDFQFSIDYSQNSVNENSLTIEANERLFRAALSNLLINCIQYSNDNKAKITIQDHEERLHIDFINQGPIISEQERQFLFQHFFRGSNSKGKKGFGLGLVLIHKIIKMSGGYVSYASFYDHINTFTISIPLR